VNTGATDAPLIRLRGVQRRFAGGTLALADTTLDIHRGGFVSLLGPSGCGKSTLLRLLAGLDAPTGGTLERASADGDTGFVFQEPTLMPWASALDNVALPLRLAGQGRAARQAAARDALAAVGLADFAQALPRELSGGMKMRVSIARALVTRPALLLLDEPFAALDEISRFRLNQDLLALWQSARFTAVFVTHSVAEAVFLSQRVLVMGPRPGRVVDEIAIDLPWPRSDATRELPAYTEACVRVSRALHAASGVAHG
jgi:NitT/TauT family transport system ATP-binding protein